MLQRLVFLFGICCTFFCLSCGSDSTAPQPQLAITASTPDSQITTAGSEFVMTLTITSDNKPVSDASIDFHDPLHQIDRHLGPSSSTGVIVYRDTMPAGVAIGTYEYSFVAKKSGSQTSKTFLQHLLVQNALALFVTARDTQVVEIGERYMFDFITSVKGVATGASLIFQDPIQNLGEHVATSASGGHYEGLVPANATPGFYTFTFTASENGLASSGTVSKLVQVIPAQTHIDLQVAFSSLNQNSIAIRWKSLGAGTAYTISAIPKGGGSVATVKTTNTFAVLQGLDPNKIYSITIGTLAGTTDAVDWAPAYRQPDGSGQAFRLYETRDNTTGHYAGLVLSSVNPHTASVVGAEAQSIDFVLAYDPSAPSPYLSVVSPSLTSLSNIANGRSTQIANNTFLVNGGLDSDYYQSPISELFGGDANYVSLTEFNQGSSLIIPFLTADGHYGRLEILPQSNGQLYGLDAKSNKFVDVRVSYQAMLNTPYAGRPHARLTRPNAATILHK